MESVHPFTPREMFFKNETDGVRWSFHAVSVICAVVGIVTTANAGSLSCWTWTVDVKPGTYDTGDSIWWKDSVQFSHSDGTCPGGWQTMGVQTCTVLNDGTCSVTLHANGSDKVCNSWSGSVTCTSPTLKIDNTPPVCGDWKYDGNNTWVPGVSDPGALSFIAAKAPNFRDVRVFASDSESGLSKSWWPQLYPSSLYDLNNADSNTVVQSALGSSAQVEVTDDAGNVSICVGPRKRMDGFDPPAPTLTCDNFMNDVRPLTYPYQGTVRCGLSDRGGPSLRKILLRARTYNANASGNVTGAAVTDTNWTDRWDMRFLADVDGNPVRSGAAYDAESAPLRYEFVPTMEKITVLSMRICEFYGTADQRCTDSNDFSIKKLSPPPPIPESIGTGWYECQNATTGNISWYSPDESIPGTNQTVVSNCSPDGVGNGEPKSKAKIAGTVGPAGTSGCWCWDDQAPTISSISVNPSTWTNQPVTVTGIAAGLDTGGAPYGGIQYSCDNGASWSTGTTSTTATFTCNIPSGAGAVAKVRACDMAANCSPSLSVQYYIDTTLPTVSNFKIVGKKRNAVGHVADGSAGTDSNQYTYAKDVTLQFTAADTLPGSGVAGAYFSCNSTAPSASASGWDSWGTSAGTKAFDLTSSSFGCSSSQGSKTVYAWTKDAAWNVSAAANATIVYDNAAPNFTVGDPILLRAIANYSYSIQNPTDAAGSSGFKDFSMTWTPESGSKTDYLDHSAATAPYSNSFADLARFVNASCDANGDGKCVAVIRITLEDNAGNSVTKDQRIEIIPSTIATVVGDVSLNSSRSNFGDTVADLEDTYTYSIHLEDANGNVVRPVPGLLEIRADWGFENNASFLGNESAYAAGDVRDGAVWYNWDDGVWAPSSDGNSTSRVYVGSSTRANGNYVLQVRSAVPTREGYPDLTRNTIKLKTVKFTNALSAPNPEGCPTGYVCSGANTNSVYDRSLGGELATNSPINQYLGFKPALEITPSKNWNDLTEGSWHDMTLTFKNNSIKYDFAPAKYGFELRYENYLAGFADLSVRGDLGDYTALSEGSLNKLSVMFGFPSGFQSVPKNSSVTKSIGIRVNSYGLGFGKIGFTGYMPWAPDKNNLICSSAGCPSVLSTTGYNTKNLGVNSGIMAFDYQSAPVPASELWTLTSSQKFAVSWQIANSGRNGLQALESGVAVDTQTIDKTQFKTNTRKNVESMTRWLASDNGSNCVVNVTDLTKDLYFYDFSKLTGSSINGNKGCMVNFKGHATGTASGYRKFGITGKKTDIIKGGNAFIDSDFYYGDSNSMLALVVLRDDADQSKGGNILVSPNVTNVVGATYAEGSLISYDGAKVYDISNTSEGDLANQLYWFGSLYSANTIGGSMKPSNWECPFGSDSYVATSAKACTEAEASRYDFAMLRRFVLIDVTATGDVCKVSWKKAPKSTGTSSAQYALAGRKKCFQTDANDVSELRSTTKTASFVMEYNSAMMTSGMKVFSK